MAKSKNAQLADARRKREAAVLKTFGGDRISASIAHHKARREHALNQSPPDYSTLHDATKALRDLGCFE